jgi:NAD dependent epimerase/dehydratase family enzyme
MASQDVSSWSLEQVVEWILTNDLGQCLDYIIENKIDGQKLLKLKPDDMKLNPSTKEKFESALQKFKQQEQKSHIPTPM